MTPSTVALLLPGMSLNATIFPPLDVSTLTTDFSRLVLGPDGSSPDLLDRRIGLYVDLLDRALAAEPAWQAPRRIVVGHSFGGMLALSWWLAHGGAGASRVDGMVLCSTTAGPMLDAARLGRGVRLPIAPLMRVWNRPLITRAMKWVLCGRLDRIDHVDFRALRSTTDTAIDIAGWRNTDWRAMRSYRLALDGFDLRRRLREITAPVIVLHGDRDPILPPALGRALAKGLPKGELRVVRTAGHGLPVTHGDEIRRAVTDLLTRV